MMSASQKVFIRFQHYPFVIQKFNKGFELLFKSQKNFSIIKKHENNQPSNELNLVDSEDINLFNYQNYSISILTQKHKESALKLFDQDFDDYNPLTKAYWRLFPQQKIPSQQSLHSFWQEIINNAIQNKLGIAVIDMVKDQLAGASIAKKFSHNLFQPEEKQIKKINLIDSVNSLQQEFIKTLKRKKLIFSKQQKIVEYYAAVIGKQHMRKKLFKHIIIGKQILAKRQGFQYIFGFATNFRTSLVCYGLGYEKVTQIDCRQFQYLGVKPFDLIEKQSSISSLWFKKLE